MKKQIYEITYWIKEGVEATKIEDEIINSFEEDFELIEKIPARTKELAYPINKEKIGQLGTIYFYSYPEKIESFKKKIQSIKEILRFIIVKRKALKKEKVETIKEETVIYNES